jgi:ectoine hydroxylase-related dioxygenase (phytanoyl-CoA dioxygenase family)
MTCMATAVDQRWLVHLTAALTERGYCVVPSLLRADTAAKLRQLIELIREHEPRPDVAELGHHRVLHLATKHRAFVDLLSHPLLVDVWAEFLGPDFVCSSLTSNTIMPGADPTYWHVDHPYWTIAEPYPVNLPLSGQAIWCLDPFEEENGATMLVPGSHRRPHMPDHQADLSHESITITAPIGSLILTHGATWHSMGRNTTSAPRTAVLARYARGFIIPQEDMHAQLEAIESPPPLVQRLLGAHQYVPQRGFPY